MDTTLTERLLTRAEAATRLGISPKTLARWEWRGMGPPRIRIGKRVMYRAVSIEAWLCSHERTYARAGAADHGARSWPS